MRGGEGTGLRGRATVMASDFPSADRWTSEWAELSKGFSREWDKFPEVSRKGISSSSGSH